MATLLNEAASELPTFQGIKYSSTDLEGAAAALRANNRQYAVFLGSNTVWKLMFFPCTWVPSRQGVWDSELESAGLCLPTKPHLSDSFALHWDYLVGAWIPSMKVAMNFITPVNVGKSRPPLNNLTEAQEEEIRDSLKAISVL
ncbi:unnamed protein product [Phaedon cochleariae]|uniref:Uncharacterized protein n=1 Tax=Phaedon cochleariae TaxID=80249 RepID=A0A9N9WYV5_PHACE|nr:unnamed protein product [Phaedon cochleariae]